MSADELVAQVAAGKLPPNVLVWWPGLEDWVALDSQPELAARLNGAQAPPPPPPAPMPPPQAADAVARAKPTASDAELDKIFVGIVEKSWKYHHLLEDTQRMDDVLVGALIAATLETGRALIDVESDGTNHFLRFQDPDDRSRVSIAVTHLTRDITTAKAVGQRAAITFAYGEAITKFGQIIDAMRKEAKSGYVKSAEPGIVTFDKEDESKYLYAQIDLFMDIDDYISSKFEVDGQKLTSWVSACTHAMRKFLRGRIEGED
jgi:hypothetical protein